MSRARAMICLRWGVRPGDRVGIYAPNCYRWLVYDLALIAIRAVSVPFTDDFAGKVNRCAAGPVQYRAAADFPKALPSCFRRSTPYVAFIDADNEASPRCPRPASNDADVADHLTLVFSSGSAGGLKGLVISREGVESTLPPIVEAIGITPSDRLLLFLPMSNFQQRTMCYAGLACDFDIIMTDYIQFFSPRSRRCNPTILIAPPIYYQMIHTRFANFPRWKRLLWTGAGAPDVAGSRRRGAAQPGATGCSRNSTSSSAADAHSDHRHGADQAQRCAVLRPDSTAAVRNLWPGGNRLAHLPAGRVEKIRLGGKTAARRRRLHWPRTAKSSCAATAFLTRRYFQCAEGENERTFIGNGRVATGDIGRFDADGYLYLLGRKKELIITPGGYKIHPEIIEARTELLPDVAQSVVFPKPGAASWWPWSCLAQPGAEAEARVEEFAAQMPSARKVRADRRRSSSRTRLSRSKTACCGPI